MFGPKDVFDVKLMEVEALGEFIEVVEYCSEWQHSYGLCIQFVP
jgi:hypothetical protein